MIVPLIRAGFISLAALIVILSLPSSLLSQECHLTLRGKVLNADTREPLSFANIVIKEYNTGVMADENGRYELTGLCAGTYTLICTYVGCDHAEHLIELRDDTSLHFYLHEEALQLDQVVISEHAVRLRPAQAVEELSGAELASGQGLNLAESISRLPGVSTLNTGATIAKPVIQGLHGNRVLILNNGVRQEGQQWGIEHAPEIDPFLADRVAVVKGAGAVRYGAGAMGGVILVEPRALRDRPGIGGEFNLQGFSNGRTGIASGMIEGQLSGKLPLTGRLQGTAKRGGNLRTPDYFLPNTGVEEYNFSWTLGLNKGPLSTEAFYSRFYSQVGIFAGSHIGNLTDLRNAIERGRPSGDGAFSYDLGRPLQRILHELVKWRSTLKTGELGELSLQYARQFNRRQEFDAHRPYGSLPTTLDRPNIEFEITTHTADLAWEHRPLANLRGQFGVQSLWQVNTVDRGALLPNYENRGLGVFWIERWKNYPFPLEFEAGLRYDYQEMHVGRQGTDTIDRDLHFRNFSANAGAIYHFPKLLHLHLSFGTAWRPPHVSELFSDGVHHGSASYEKGNPDLRSERAYHTSLTIDLDNKRNLSATASLYYNLIDDFIYLAPRPEPILSIRGAFPAFDYRQTDARLMGLDARLDYTVRRRLTLESRVSLLRGWNRTDREHLFFLPADNFQTGLRFAFGPEPQRDEAPFVRLTMINVLEQTRVPAGRDYAPPPPGHTRFNLEAGATLHWNNQPIELGLTVFNLFDTRYREYLNRFRYFADEVGRNVSLRIRVPFGN